MSELNTNNMKYPIGIQTFEEVINGGYVYVDKTDLVYKLIDTGKYYFLSRPRRFGKSLLTTTLEAYFQGRKELFRGLAMEQLEKNWVEYPVFHLDFSGEVYDTTKTLNEAIENSLEDWEKTYGDSQGKKSVGTRFYNLITKAYEKTNKKVVILIDEYDKPLTDVIGNTKTQDKNRTILQKLYGNFKKADKYIKFVFLTGVTEYGKLGIFSAANNPIDISISDEYATICGITETELHSYFDDEVQLFADKYSVSKSDMYAMLKRKFDGYHFSERSEDVYNPFSLLNALYNKKILNYWFATGTPTYLVKILAKSDIDIPSFDNELLATREMLATFGNGESNVIAALYQSGYLTIKGYQDECYLLGFPNEEVSEGFTRILIPNYTKSSTSDKKDLDLTRLRQLIKADDVDGFMKQIQLIIGQIPFEKENEHNMIELHFRNMIYLIIRSTGHKVFVEHPVLCGRIDVFFETEKCAYVIECKRDLSAKKALAQIDENKYAQKISSASKQVVKIGVNFSTKERNLVEWTIG